MIREEHMKETKARLRMYPQLKRNLERYKLDKEDIMKEEFGISKSIVIKAPSNGMRLSLEEKRALRIILIEEKEERDLAEVKEIESAMRTLTAESQRMIEARYFEGLNYRLMSERYKVEESTISRRLKRALMEMCIGLYGAVAMKKIL